MYVRKYMLLAETYIDNLQDTTNIISSDNIIIRMDDFNGNIFGKLEKFNEQWRTTHISLPKNELKINK